MLPTNLENIEGRQLSEQELDSLYLYLDMYLEGMSDEEKIFWMQVMSNVDKQFYEDSGNGTNELQTLQDTEDIS